MRRALACLAALAILAPVPASAQDMGWSTIIPSVTGTDQLGLFLRDEMAKARAARGGTAEPAPAPAQAVASTRFTPSKARRQANLAGFVARTRAVSPPDADQLQATFAQGDFIEKVGGAIAPYGLRTDDLADAYALWWISAWQASRGASDTPSQATVRAVRSQAARALAASPLLNGAGDAGKQELAESLLVQAVILEGAVEQSKADPAQLRAVAAAAAQGARGMGLDLAAMRLTEQGFVAAG